MSKERKREHKRRSRGRERPCPQRDEQAPAIPYPAKERRQLGMLFGHHPSLRPRTPSAARLTTMSSNPYHHSP